MEIAGYIFRIGVMDEHEQELMWCSSDPPPRLWPSMGESKPLQNAGSTDCQGAVTAKGDQYMFQWIAHAKSSFEGLLTLLSFDTTGSQNLASGHVLEIYWGPISP